MGTHIKQASKQATADNQHHSVRTQNMAASTINIAVLHHAQGEAIIEIAADATVEDALDILTTNNILALPVRDAETNLVLGMVNMLDIAVHCVLKVFNDDPTNHDAGLQRLDDPIVNALGLTAESENLWTWGHSATLADVQSAFAAGVHRIVIQDESDPQNIRLLSQTDVVKHMLAHPEDFSAALNITASDVMTSPVTSMEASEAALVGFTKLANKEVNALCLVNADGKAVGVLSASDLRGIKKNDFGVILKPAGEFKADRGAAAEVVACAADETLGEVLQRAVDAKVHRVWVLADDGSPEGVVTFSDAIAKIA